MAYIGREPQIGNFQVCDAISVVNNQAAYTMQVGSVNVSPESANHMLVSLNGILQRPNSSFTVSSSTITFAANLVTGDVINFIQILGNVLDLGVPSDATVSTAKIVDNAVTLAKMASGTDGNIISYDTSGNPVAVATGNDGQVLTSAGAGAVPTFETLPVGGITMADMWRTTADKTGAGQITANWERADTLSAGFIGTGLSESSGVFTFPTTGIYQIFSTAYMASSGDIGYAGIAIQITTNNSSYTTASESYNNCVGSGKNLSTFATYVLDVTNTTNIKFRLNGAANANVTYGGSTASNLTNVVVIRLGDT